MICLDACPVNRFWLCLSIRPRQNDKMIYFVTLFKVEILLRDHWLSTWPMTVQSMCWLGMKVDIEWLMDLRQVDMERETEEAEAILLTWCICDNVPGRNVATSACAKDCTERTRG